MTLTHALLALAAWLAPAALSAAAVGDALQRPALQVRQPERAVLLSAAKAGQRIVAVGERGIIAISDDGGTQWRQAPCPVSVTLTVVRFADAMHGVAVGHGGTVLTSADGGANWTLRLDGRRLAALALEAAGNPSERRDAERLAADGPDKPFLDVQMFDSQRILAVGAYGIAFYSGNGGASWAPWMARLANPKGLHWYVLRRHGDTLLLAGEQGLLMRSDDAGASFKALASPYKGSWFAGELTATSTVLAGLRGNVWISSDGGSAWQPLQAPSAASFTASSVGADGSVWLANQGGMLMRWQGAALEVLPGKPLAPPSGLLQLDQRMLVLGPAGVTAVPAPGATP